MTVYTSKLVVLRGNSGSGKSTVARMVRQASRRKIAIVEQDYLRRFLLKEKETEGGDNIDLIYQTVTFALSRHYDVILEGILVFDRYGRMLSELASQCPDHHFYYFDISFEETLKRHATKSNAHEFGEEDMRAWYKERDLTGFSNETIIREDLTPRGTVEMIVDQCSL